MKLKFINSLTINKEVELQMTNVTLLYCCHERISEVEFVEKIMSNLNKPHERSVLQAGCTSIRFHVHVTPEIVVKQYEHNNSLWTISQPKYMPNADQLSLNHLIIEY